MSRKRVVGLLFIEEKITVKKYQNSVFRLLAQLEENKRDFFFHKDWANAYTAKAKTDFMQDSLGDGLGVDSGHHSHQTLGNLTSSYGDILNEEYTAITQEAWRNLNVKMSKTLPALNNKLLKNLQKALREWRILVFKKWRGKFSAFVVITHFYHNRRIFKNRISGLQYCVGYYTVHSALYGTLCIIRYNLHYTVHCIIRYTLYYMVHSVL